MLKGVCNFLCINVFHHAVCKRLVAALKMASPLSLSVVKFSTSCNVAPPPLYRLMGCVLKSTICEMATTFDFGWQMLSANHILSCSVMPLVLQNCRAMCVIETYGG